MILSHPTTKKIVESGTVVTIYGVTGHYEPSGIKEDHSYKDCLVLSNVREPQNILALGVKHIDENGNLRKSWKINFFDFEKETETQEKLKEIYALFEKE